MNQKPNIFVYGTARSGTTALLTAFNTSPECLLLSEADIHLHWHEPNFPRIFNNKKWQEKTLLSGKGNILLGNVEQSSTGEAVFKSLQESYRFVGDKFAVGPGRPENTSILDFLATNFFDAYHIVSVRHPDSNVESLKNMFPAVSYMDLYQHWINSFIVSYVISSCFPRAFLVFHEDISEAVVVRLAQRIGLKLAVPNGSIGSKFWKTSKIPQNLTDDEENKRAAAIACFELIQCNYDPENFSIPIINRNSTPGGLISSTLIDEILNSMDDFVFTALNPDENTETSYIARLHKLELQQELGTEAALELAKEAVKRFPENERLNYLLGVIMLNRNITPLEAIQHFDTSMAGGGDPFWNLIHRAQAHLRLADIDAAQSDVAKASCINPNSPQLPDVISLIEQARVNLSIVS